MPTLEYRPRGGCARVFDERAPEVIVDGPAGTGKSRAICEYLNWVAETYSGCRILIFRKTRVSCTESVLVTFEDKVLWPGHPVLNGPTRAHRSSYQYPNGSVIVVGGMDNATRLFSTEYDIAYCNECNELTEGEWESIHRALRNGKVPWQQLIGDCNPDAPSHWANQRCIKGKAKRISTRHTDNPSLTPTYLANLGSKLSGVRRRRLFLGEWCAAEGAVWENFDSTIHCVDKPIPDLRWYFASVDWGYTAPGTLQVWGVDGDKRLCMVAEVYRTQRLLEWWVEVMLDLHKEFDLRRIVCDPSRNESVEAFNTHLVRKGRSAIADGADNTRTSSGKGDLAGLDLVRSGFENKRIFLVRDSLRYGRDESLSEASQPWCLEQEIPSYVYALDDTRPNREQTDPMCADHGCFVAGTPVLMADGSWLPIESVRDGYLVWTPNGPERVTCSGSVGMKDTVLLTFDDGLILRCTPDHPIHQVGGGMTRCDMLPIGAWVSTVAEKHARSLAWCGSGIPKAQTGAFATSDAEESFSIASSTNAKTGRSPTECTFTIGTATSQTIGSRILESCLQPITARSIASIPRDSVSAGRTGASKERSGVGAWNAEPMYPSKSSHGLGTARTSASRLGGERLGSTTSGETASSASRFSRSTDTLAPGLVARRVLTRSRASRAEVFNLTVEPTHVYIAGGVLVSNCDALRYAVNFAWLRNLEKLPTPSKFAPGTFGKLLGHDEPKADLF